MLGGLAVVSFTLAFYGSAVGLILGHLRLPLMTYYLGGAAAGSAANLAISGLGALTGTIRHARDGRVCWRVLLLMGGPSVAGALLGVCFLVRLPGAWASLFVGGFLLVSGANLLVARPADAAAAELGRGVRLGLEILIGVALGFLAAVTGLMMGSVRLPMMIRLLRIDPRVAVGSNMAIGCLTAFVSSLTLWTQPGTFHLLPLLVVGPPTVLGGWLGARWTGRFQKETLQGLVGWAVVCSGLVMVGEGALKTTRPVRRLAAVLPRRATLP